MAKSLSSSKDKPLARSRIRGSARSIASEAADNSTSENSMADEATRHMMIAEAAYYRAEQRGFAPGFELDDWLASESELNARIQSRSLVHSGVGSKEMH